MYTFSLPSEDATSIRNLCVAFVAKLGHAELIFLGLTRTLLDVQQSPVNKLWIVYPHYPHMYKSHS